MTTNNKLAMSSDTSLETIQQSYQVPRGLALPKFNTKVWDELAAKLTSKAERDQEKLLRGRLIDIETTFSHMRYQKGELLARFKTLYKVNGQWKDFCGAYSISVSSADDLIRDYEAANTVSVEIRQGLLNAGIDIAEKKNKHYLTFAQAATKQIADSGVLTDKKLSEDQRKSKLTDQLYIIQGQAMKAKREEPNKAKVSRKAVSEKWDEFLKSNYEGKTKAVAEADFVAACSRFSFATIESVDDELSADEEAELTA